MNIIKWILLLAMFKYSQGWTTEELRKMWDLKHKDKVSSTPLVQGTTESRTEKPAPIKVIFMFHLYTNFLISNRKIRVVV